MATSAAGGLHPTDAPNFLTSVGNPGSFLGLCLVTVTTEPGYPTAPGQEAWTEGEEKRGEVSMAGFRLPWALNPHPEQGLASLGFPCIDRPPTNHP